MAVEAEIAAEQAQKGLVMAELVGAQLQRARNGQTTSRVPAAAVAGARPTGLASGVGWLGNK